MLGNHSTALLEVGHQREHRDERYFWIQEQVQDEDFSVRKEKNCANVGKKPIIASVLQKKPRMDLVIGCSPGMHVQTRYEHGGLGMYTETRCKLGDTNTETETETDSCQC